jgi:YgiT-type zinc finger domain-containing protein
MSHYDFQCEYCDGMVRERVIEREPISLSRGIVILEHVPIGVCDRCSAHYYAAPVLRRAESVLAPPGSSPAPGGPSDPRPPRTLPVPIADFRDTQAA